MKSPSGQQVLPVPASLLPHCGAGPAVAGACPHPPQEAARIGFGAWGSGWQQWNSALAWVGSEMEAEFEGCHYCSVSAM